MSWLTTIVKHVDYLRDRYAAFPVRDERARAGVLHVLDEVRRRELKRVHGRSTLESAAFVDADVRDELYALEDTQKGEIIGCIRLTMADQLAAIADSRAEYHLDEFPPALLARTWIVTRLAILPPYRKTAASLVLFRTTYADSLTRNILLSLLSCEPGLYAGYLRLGYRPLGGVHQGASGGFRIPMVAIHHDEEYLRRVRSPLLRQLANAPRPLPQDGVSWYRALEARTGPIDPGVAFFAEDAGPEVHAQLTQGLSKAGRAQLLRNAMEVKCRHGDVILNAGDGGRNMGFVKQGAVQVQDGTRLIGMLGEGELFGEMAAVLDTTRAASVIAVGDDTRLLMLSQTSLERLKSPADVAQVWRNIARVLATRARRGHE
ncbi:MAG TPA: cyclic nucleotide-binding domain-containing protein [Burkholderiaceae bacterium]|nr:cyclic nucleotide-binding domain-containing protein [Burkholderiaceae bacterium]